MKNKLLILILFLFIIANFAFTQDNPFSGGNDNKQVEKTKNKIHRNKLIWRKFSVFMAKLNRMLREQFKKLENDFNFLHFLLLIGIAFLYGFFHAAGPGHGKVLLISYFAGNDSNILDGVFVSLFIGTLHTGMGLLLAVLFSTIFKKVSGSIKMNLQNYFYIISGILIICLGIFLILKNIISKRIKNNNEYSKEKSRVAKYGSIFQAGLAVGIVPCPLAMTIAIFTFTMNYYLIGFVAIASISIGLSFFLMIISIISIKSFHNSLFNHLVNNNTYIKRFLEVLHYLSSILIIIIGLVIAITSFNFDNVIK